MNVCRGLCLKFVDMKPDFLMNVLMWSMISKQNSYETDDFQHAQIRFLSPHSRYRFSDIDVANFGFENYSWKKGQQRDIGIG